MNNDVLVGINVMEAVTDVVVEHGTKTAISAALNAIGAALLAEGNDGITVKDHPIFEDFVFQIRERISDVLLQLELVHDDVEAELDEDADG